MFKYIQKLKHRAFGFTIVELLIAIVIIGVLAMIAIASYSGITQKAYGISTKSDLSNSHKMLEIFKINNSKFPDTIDCSAPNSDTNQCLNVSTGSTYSYKVTSSQNKNIYCLEVTKNNQTHNTTQDGKILSGPCPVLNLDSSNRLSYPGNGDTWYDLSGYDNNGTLHNNIAYSLNDSGIFDLDGIDDYIKINDSASLKPSSITIIIRSKNTGNLDCDANNNWRSLIRKTMSNGGLSGFDIVFEQNNSLAWDTGNGASDRWWPAITALTINNWYEIGVSYDENGSKSLYINGALAKTRASSPGPISYIDGDPIYISNETSTSCPTYFGSFLGAIKNVKIFNKSLSPDVINDLYKEAK